MPAEPSGVDTAQISSIDKMSGTTPKTFGESTQATPAFSYAEAAKGRAPSVPAIKPNNKALSDTTETDSKQTTTSESRNIVSDSGQSSIKRTASEGRTPLEQGFKTGKEQEQSQSAETKEAVKHENTLEKAIAAEGSKIDESTTSSPDYGTTSTSTLPKEDEIFSNGTASLDSSSDKQSQSSQAGQKASEKLEVEKDQNQDKTDWKDESTASASFREAPAPIVNIWEQRREEQAKMKQSAPIQAPKPANTNPGLPSQGSSSGKSTETSADQKKQDGRKKSRNGPPNSEERSGAIVPREGSKSADGVEKPTQATMSPPPPPGDAISWPTPETAISDERKKSHDQMEKAEKENLPINKTHGKQKYEKMDFVPTAVFNTPLPTNRRGGRTQRGGRDNGARGGNAASSANGSERSMTAATSPAGQTPAQGGNERGRVASGFTTTNTTTSKPKRASSAGPATPQEQRRPLGVPAPEKRGENEGSLAKPGQGFANAKNEARGVTPLVISGDFQAANVTGKTHDGHAKKHGDMALGNVEEDRRLPNGTAETNSQSRQSLPERRSEGSVRISDTPREGQGHQASRERGEGRAERGRGGYRGRGASNHPHYNQNSHNGSGYPNGHQTQFPYSSAAGSKTYSNHERLTSQSQSFQPQNPNGRHYRTNSRSQSIPYSTPQSRYSNGYHGPPPHLAHLQTDMANEYGYQPGNQGIMSAIPYNQNPMMEDLHTVGILQMQLEYYFSVDNLCKDMHLRKSMDSQGFVPLTFILDFNRMKSLNPTPYQIHSACRSSTTLELFNINGVDLLRRRGEWEPWVLATNERYPAAQNDGPQLPRTSYPYAFDPIQMMNDHQRYGARPGFVGNAMESIQYQPANDVSPFGPGVPPPTMNGANESTTQTPLSAAVSEFSPSVRSANHRNLSTPDPHTQQTISFTDEQVDNLMICVRPQASTSTTASPPFHTASSRTFSNGSIDGRSIGEELHKFAEQQPRPSVNGDASTK